MRFDLDKVFGVHEQGIRIRSRRAEILASNLANADTPNYKARDIDFRQALNQAQQNTSADRMKVSHPKHIQRGLSAGGLTTDLLYRNPLQPSVDGNTVDTQQEKAQFVQNAMQYQASLRFLTGKIKAIKSAIKGE